MAPIMACPLEREQRPQPRLSLIGCGRTGKTLGRLWQERNVFVIGDILTRSLASASQAADFIGAGRPVATFDALQAADIYLIATPDDVIRICGHRLAAAGVSRRGEIVCHCSGALPAAVLEQPMRAGALTASIHPIKSFADPDTARATFAGTLCALEGNPQAVARLQSALTAIGANCFPIDTEQKAIYHAGMTMASNYLTTLLATAERFFCRAGLSPQRRKEIIDLLAKGTLDNVSGLGPTAALTGPIARGDAATVGCHLEAIAPMGATVLELYRNLGFLTLELSRQQGLAAPDRLAEISRLLQGGAE